MGWNAKSSAGPSAYQGGRAGSAACGDTSQAGFISPDCTFCTLHLVSGVSLVTEKHQYLLLTGRWQRTNPHCTDERPLPGQVCRGVPAAPRMLHQWTRLQKDKAW